MKNAIIHRSGGVRREFAEFILNCDGQTLFDILNAISKDSASEHSEISEILTKIRTQNN